MATRTEPGTRVRTCTPCNTSGPDGCFHDARQSGMVRAGLDEVIRQERAAGSTDDEIALLFRRSRFRLPEGLFHHWTAIAVRAVMAEDEGGYPLYGNARR